MLKNYIKEYLDSGKTLEDLKNEYGIDARESVDGLVIFSYSQIDSPKTDPIVRMSRGLVLEKGTWEIVNFPFNRFYNFEEVPEERVKFNWDNAVATTKVDGSLLSCWNYKGKWQISTRSCIGGTNKVNDFGVTFNDLFDEAIKPFSREEFFRTLRTDWCYIFELVSPMNIIVTPYKETKLYCLGARQITTLGPLYEKDFTYVWNYHHMVWKDVILKPEIISLTDSSGHFKGFKEMKDLAESVGEKDEGFVVVDYSTYDNTDSFPRVKVKNSAYLVLHHLRGQLDNGTPNFGELLTLVYKNEQDEVISSLPQFEKIIRDVETKWNNFEITFKNICSDSSLEKFWNMPMEERVKPENKKEFALLVNDKFKRFSAFLFVMFNKNITSLREYLEKLAEKKPLNDVLKNLWENYIKEQK